MKMNIVNNIDRIVKLKWRHIKAKDTKGFQLVYENNNYRSMINEK